MKFLYLLFISSLATAQQIDLSSLDKTTQSYLRKNYSHLLTSPTNKARVDGIIKAIYASGNFEKIEAHLSNKKYHFKVTRIPRISNVKIVTDYSTSVIEQELAISKNEKFDKSLLQKRLNQVKEILNKNGHFHPKLSYDLKNISPGNSELQVYVQKGGQTHIKKITILTENKSLKSDLQKHTSDIVGKPLSELTMSKLEKNIKSYLLDNQFYVAQLQDPEIQFLPSSTEALLTINISAANSFRFKFNGNSKYNSSFLLKQINLEKAPPSRLNPGIEISERIRSFYVSKGYSNVSISVTEKENTKNFNYDIVFDIKEGRQVEILNVNFEGRISRKSSYYEELFFENSEEIIEDHIYNKEALDTSLQRLILLLKNEGFLQANLISTRITPNKDKSGTYITCILDEGPLTTLETIEFSGAKSFSRNTLLETVGLQENSPLKLNQLEIARENLKKLYLNNSYLEMQFLTPISESIFYNEDKTEVNLVFKISEGTKIKASSIHIRGNEKTKNSVILNSLYFSQGEYLTPLSIQESVASLQRLGLFQAIDIKIQEGVSENRTILVTVRERNPGLFTFGIGVTNEDRVTVRGYSGIGYRNLGGYARSVSARAEVQYKLFKDNFIENKVTASYLEPFLFSSKTQGRVNLSRSQEIFDSDNEEGLISNEINFNLSRNFSQHLKVDWKLWGLEQTEKFELEDRSIREEFKIASLGPLVEWDYRDNLFVPKQGTLTRLRAEYSDPEIGSSDTVNYIRLNINFNHYIPLTDSKRHIIAYSLRGGYLKNLGENTAVPKEKMFFIGGRSTLRGYPYISIPDESQILEAGDDFVSLSTESHFYLGKFEYRFPIYDIFGGAIFYDGGSVNILGKDIHPLYRDSAGLSLQIQTPIGALSIGYGHKLNRQNGESPGEWFLSIGDF